jgi:hypothetical protein
VLEDALLHAQRQLSQILESAPSVAARHLLQHSLLLGTGWQVEQ